MLSVEDCLAALAAAGSPRNVAGMARYGIVGDEPFGAPMPAIRRLAKQAGRDHALALALWRSGRHEARILAALVDEPARVTRAQMRRWAKDFRSWDVCDQVCTSLFEKSPFADEMIHEWARDEREFVKRAAFATIVGVAAHQKDAPVARILAYLPLVEDASDDERNYVKKGVSWALRTIGKRGLRREALACAKRIRGRGTRGARWVASDVLRELGSR